MGTVSEIEFSLIRRHNFHIAPWPPERTPRPQVGNHLSRRCKYKSHARCRRTSKKRINTSSAVAGTQCQLLPFSLAGAFFRNGSSCCIADRSKRSTFVRGNNEEITFCLSVCRSFSFFFSRMIMFVIKYVIRYFMDNGGFNFENYKNYAFCKQKLLLHKIFFCNSRQKYIFNISAVPQDHTQGKTRKASIGRVH